MNTPTKLQLAASVFNVEQSSLSFFENVIDLFNPENVISGYICHQSDYRYGAILVTEVNGEAVDNNIVYATPKLHYPFGRVVNNEGNRKYNWPKNIYQIRVYQKLDGTNVLAYSYSNADGKRFVTFKTRLTPILKDGAYGSFYQLWEEILQKYPDLRKPSRVLKGEVSLSFELYGFRNQHLVVYPVGLDVKLLFGVDQWGSRVLLPEFFSSSIPDEVILNAESIIENLDSVTEQYEKWRESAEKQNNRLLNDSGETEAVEGIEGYIFYIQDSEGWTQWKCKPQSIEALHWASDTIPESIIRPTVINAFESQDVLTIEYVSKLLREEFTETQVLASQTRIEKVIRSIIEQINFQKKVASIFHASGLNVHEHGKNEVMRYMSRFFNRDMMKKVYTAMKQVGIVE